MKRMRKTALLLVSLFLLPGCYDQMILEDLSITLMIGLDLDDSDRLIVYTQSPVYYKEAKEKSENAAVMVSSLREARTRLDGILTGVTTSGKNQTLLIGRRLLEHKDWHGLLDILFRDPKQSLTQRVVVVDGTVADVIYFQPRDKPRLSLHMRKLVDTANRRNISVITRLHELRRQIKDKGLTPSLTEIKKEADKVMVTGTVLLNKKGEYATNLSIQESTLLLILQNRFKSRELTITLPGSQTAIGGGGTPTMTVSGRVKKLKVKTTYTDTSFQFEITPELNAFVTSYDNAEHADLRDIQTELEQRITDYLRNRFEDLIKKCQNKEIDPFGFGLYARAYQYRDWKTVQDDWGKSFAKAKIQIHPEVEIKSFGVID